MAEFEKRIAELTPEMRRIVAEKARMQLRAGGARKNESTTVATATKEEFLALDAASPSEPDESKASYKRFYDGVSEQLSSNLFGRFSFFLNYGYKPDGQPEYSQIVLPEQYINKNSVKLVLEVIGDCPVDGKRVLDVGCGRGGTVHVLQTFFKPAGIQALDLSTRAIDFCRSAHKRADTTFYEGDAESLPLADGSVDIVTNLESSHSYPNINKFYSEVYRVLSPGGQFLYTDTLAIQHMATCIGFLQFIGFELERDRDITRNVLLSCNEIAATRVQAFDSRNDPGLMQNFLAMPGSQVYQEMQSGRWTYRILKLRKRA